MRRCLRIAIASSIAGIAGSAVVAAEPASGAPSVDQVAPVVAQASPLIPGGQRPVVVSDTGWVKARAVLEAGACGTTISGYPKDPSADTRQKRTVTYKNGDVVTLLRGSVTLTVGQAHDGWPSTPVLGQQVEVFVSGAVIRVDYVSGASFVNREAPGIIAVHTSPHAPGPERSAFLKARLPGLAVLKKGALTEYTNASATRTRLLREPTELLNMCDVVGISSHRDSPVLVYQAEGI